MNIVPGFPQGPSLLSSIIEQDFDSSLVKIGTLINDLNLLEVDLLLSTNIIVGDIEIYSNRIRSLEDPILDHQAGTKNYVDTKEIETYGPENSVLFKSRINSSNGNLFYGSSDLTFTTSTLNINGILNTSTLTCSSIEIGGINIYAIPEETYSLTVPSSYGASNSMLGVNSSNVLTFFSNTLPSGSNGEIQFNNAGSFGSSPDCKFIDDILYSNLYCNQLSCVDILSEQYLVIYSYYQFALVFDFALANYNFIWPKYSATSGQVMGIDQVGNVFWTNNGTLSPNIAAIQFNNSYNYDSSSNFNYSSINNVLNVDNLMTQTPETPIILNTASIGFNIGKACADLEYTYICLTNSIKVINASQVGQITIAITGNVINAVVNNYLYVISQNGSTGYLSVISNFQVISQTTIPLILTNLYVQGSYAYVVGSSSLYIIDITSPSLLTVAIIPTPTVPNATSVRVLNDYIYVSCNNDIFSLVILNGSNESSTSSQYSVVNTTNITLLGCIGLAVLGQYVYTIGSSLFNVIDVSDPSVPVIVKTITLGINLTDIYVTAQFAYVCCSNNLSTSGVLYVINLDTFEVTTFSSPLLLSAKSIIVLSCGNIGICTELLLNTFNTSILTSSNISNILVTDLKVSSTVYCSGNLNSKSSITSVSTNMDRLLINSTEVSVSTFPAVITNDSSSTSSNKFSTSFIISCSTSLVMEAVLQITINSRNITSESIIITSIYNCSNNSIIPAINVISVVAGSAIIKVKNVGLINFSGTVKIFCLII